MNPLKYSPPDVRSPYDSKEKLLIESPYVRTNIFRPRTYYSRVKNKDSVNLREGLMNVGSYF